MTPVTSTDLKGNLPLIARGKVRDLYQVSEDSLLFVATDRISAFDVIMENGVTDKGRILTKLSKFWFNLLSNITENHLITSSDAELFQKLPQEISGNPELKSQLEGRSLLVRKYKILPLEVIVRGYITGSAWKEYQKQGTVHGIKVPQGLKECQELPTPIYTPSTKAEQGEHDENISPEQAERIVGHELAAKIEKVALDLYNKAREYAKTRGIIIADTKFEFGVDENNNLVLVDEVLTPDSSRFWNASTYEIGRDQDSYDKQFLRNWLISKNLKGVEGVSMPEDIVSKTKEKYVEAYEVLTGEKW
jgi:phosphoribosylaminoimidazole-succinocarboxamide synthase